MSGEPASPELTKAPEPKSGILSRIKDRVIPKPRELRLPYGMVMKDFDPRIKARILYENSRFGKDFDYFAEKLLAYARSGEGGGQDPNESPTYQRRREITLPDGRKFSIMDINRLGELTAKSDWLVDIRPNDRQAEKDGRFEFYGAGAVRLVDI